jgi:hypothetical protein
MTDNYKSENLRWRVIHPTERRIRDLSLAPKRRVTDAKAVKAEKVDRVSLRELELLDLIDGHIARLRDNKD